MLAIAVAARGERARLHDRLPEERRRAEVRRLSRQLVEPQEADDFRNLRVRVEAVERVAVVRQRVEQRTVRELTRERQVLRIVRERVEIGEDLVHTAVL